MAEKEVFDEEGIVLLQVPAELLNRTKPTKTINRLAFDALEADFFISVDVSQRVKIAHGNAAEIAMFVLAKAN